jgi:hypothetical protein
LRRNGNGIGGDVSHAASFFLIFFWFRVFFFRALAYNQKKRAQVLGNFAENPIDHDPALNLQLKGRALGIPLMTAAILGFRQIFGRFSPESGMVFWGELSGESSGG